MPVDPARSPSTSPFSSPDEADDRDKSWVQDNKLAEPTAAQSSVESKLSPVVVNEPDEVVKGETSNTKDDMEWLRNLEEIEKEAFGFIEAQGLPKQPKKIEPEPEPEKVRFGMNFSELAEHGYVCLIV